ncbi:MAG TPA: hypothetical protein VGO96_02070 [Pyrinomonadaceae bacterium]|nr:hypothetical protein [Pyrinomonadaceae bacterium]
MKTSRKTSLLIIALALLACLVWLVWLVLRPDEPYAATGSGTSRGQSFEVRVEKPRMDRFLGGILPTKIEAKLLGGELRFDQASRGAQVGSVRPDRLELRAEGWELFIEIDGEGRIAPGTRLVFPIEIAEKLWTLRCRPADRPTGYLRTATRAGSDVLDGNFLVELARCEDAGTGKIIDTEAGGNPGDAWPSSPLTLRGSFNGLPQVRP